MAGPGTHPALYSAPLRATHASGGAHGFSENSTRAGDFQTNQPNRGAADPDIRGIASRAEAVAIVYTDRNAFYAAVGDTTLLTFDEPAVCQPHIFPMFCTVDYGLVTKRYEFPFAVPPGYIPPPYIHIGSATDGNLPITFTQPVTAIGFDVIPFQSTIAFNVSIGDQLFFSPTGFFSMSSPSFLGFVSTEPLGSHLFIDHYRCQSGAILVPCQFGIDNMALQVLEPATLWLVCPAAIWAVRRRRRTEFAGEA